MPTPNDEFTLGVEEEYQIVNPTSRELRPRASRILPEVPRGRRAGGHHQKTSAASAAI